MKEAMRTSLPMFTHFFGIIYLFLRLLENKPSNCDYYRETFPILFGLVLPLLCKEPS